MILGLGSLGELSPLGTLDHEDVSSSDVIPGSSEFPSSSEFIPSSELQPSSSEEPLPPLTDRYPEAPGNIFVGGIRLAWSHRDRLQQTAAIIDQYAGNIGPEPGTTYTIRVYDLTTVQAEAVTDDQLIIEIEGITGAEQILYPPSEFAADVLIHLLSVRDGYESWQAHALLIFWASNFRILSSDVSEGFDSSDEFALTSSETAGSEPVGEVILAKVALSGNLTGVPTTYIIPWSLEVEDLGGFWDPGLPTRLTIPAGVSRVRLRGSVRAEDNPTTHSITAVVLKNGVQMTGSSMQQHRAIATGSGINVAWCVTWGEPVIEGDYFELEYGHGGAATDVIQANAATWFEIEAIPE